jgi:hypothetical protein
MPARLGRVEVVVPSGDVVTLTWQAREELVAELRPHESLKAIVDDFLNAGASRPVRIPRERKLTVASVIESIGRESSSGLVGLEGGLYELRNALVDEMPP